MLGKGHHVDLVNLFAVVRDKGGYDAVCKNGTWDMVAEESGLGLTLASSVKLIYMKHLDALEKRVGRVVDDKDLKAKSCDSSSTSFCGVTMELGAEFKEFLMNMQGSRYVDLKSELSLNTNTIIESCESEKFDVDDEESSFLDSAKSVVDSIEVSTMSNDVIKSSEMDSFTGGDEKTHDNVENPASYLRKSEEVRNEDEKSVVMEMDEVNKCDESSENILELELSITEEFSSSRKRKRESMYKILNWITGIARDPCDPEVVPIPESSKWNSFGNEEFWKQVLLLREALFLKRNVDSGAERSLQKNQKMHPSMYDDHVGSRYNFRERLRCSNKLLLREAREPQSSSKSASSATRSEVGYCSEGISHDFLSKHPVLGLPIENIIPLGPDFQAEVPEWTGVVSETDIKWLGTQIWPLEKVESKFIVERGVIGKGRQDSCRCKVPKSTECVKLHATESKLRVKQELGIAFIQLGFNKMGEEVRLTWTKAEEKKFNTIVRSNPSCFWDEIVKSFPTKRLEDLVSYYYNVFLLERRAKQNRFSPGNINSDDDDNDDDDSNDSECVSVTNGSRHGSAKSPGSLISSGRKVRKNVK
ncbi:hypothetical protein K2173_013330 [Erythroxylum novogranatense]|uniref:ARID domain-containing protein n=1 Tax=Erythroxylum novogranatense TaxID=1862640 RepID=A0AAV8S9L8_9ROSI|nr:hypothetical protein K2173_013330 [Erythroxylum novogranatense]